MATFSIQNFGCRATDADATALRAGLVERGMALATGHGSADFVVLNTCTVTAAADAQARDAVRKIHRENPAARIIVTGCYAQRAPDELAVLDGVAWVVGNSHQAEIPLQIGSIATSASQENFVPISALTASEQDEMSLARGPAKILTGDIFAQADLAIAPAALPAGDRTRPILKIQDGCNNRCSYCVIPFVRGRSRSLPPDAVVAEVRKLAEAGAREIVLSGINLGSYGRDLTPRASLAGVVQRILTETEIERLRCSSIEPQDVTEDFVELITASQRLAPHFHIPLQSGCDRILHAMHRWYRAEHYAERVKLVKRALPDAAIGADVIAGFPSETAEDFEATVKFIEGLPFTYLHVFSFSPRPGTRAAESKAFVPAETIRRRARALRELGRNKAEAFRASQAGRKMRALTLHRQGEGWTEALTGNYLRVRIPGLVAANEWREVRVNAEEFPA